MQKRVSPRHVVALAVAALLFTGCADDPAAPPLAPEESPRLTTVAAPETTGNHLVMFSALAIPSSFERRLTGMGGVLEKAFAPIGVAVVSGLSDDAAAELAGAEGVIGIEPDVIVPLEEPQGVDEPEVADDAPATHDPSGAFFFPRQWHHRVIQADLAWAAGLLGSPDVTVSIIDSGLDYNHASLQGLVDLDRSISLHPWDDELLEEHFPGAHPIADMNRHGTHVGATVVSTGEVGAGVTGHTTLFGVKVCGAFVGCPRSAVLEAVMYSADNGADVINMSLGGTFLLREDRGFWLPIILRATNYAHRQGALVVVSAGNDATDLDRDIAPPEENGEEPVHLPSLFKTYCNATNVVCVSATGPTFRETINGPWNDFDQPAFFTNYGRSAIDVAAPGGNSFNFVYAACSSFSLRSTGCQRSNRFIIGIRGTSMAAPHATGVAALIVAHDVGKGNPGLVRNRLQQSADQITHDGNDPYFGKGRINAARAVGLLGDTEE